MQGNKTIQLQITVKAIDNLTVTKTIHAHSHTPLHTRTHEFTENLFNLPSTIAKTQNENFVCIRKKQRKKRSWKNIWNKIESARKLQPSVLDCDIPAKQLTNNI